MPNYCSNLVHITGHELKMLDLKAAAERGQLFQLVSPVGPVVLPDPFGANKLEAQMAAWGTKWEVSEYNHIELEGDTLTLGFETAWNPPIRVYEKLQELGYGVTGYYYEPGCDFAGIWCDGSDNCIDGGALQAARDGTMDDDLFEAMRFGEYLDSEDDEEDDEENGLVPATPETWPKGIDRT